MGTEVHCEDCGKLIGYTDYSGPIGYIRCIECEEEDDGSSNT